MIPKFILSPNPHVGFMSGVSRSPQGPPCESNACMLPWMVTDRGANATRSRNIHDTLADLAAPNEAIPTALAACRPGRRHALSLDRPVFLQGTVPVAASRRIFLALGLSG